MENNKKLLANFILSDKELETLYINKLSDINGGVSTYRFSDEGADYVIEKAQDIITLMQEYKGKTKKFGIIETKVNK